MLLYPMLLKPILVGRIWGGQMLAQRYFNHYDHNNTNETTNIGEAWLLADRQEQQSIVLNGPYQGLSIQELRLHLKHYLTGSKINYQTHLPLLVKMLDAKQDLSIQVHPKATDVLHFSQHVQSKSEFWYMLNCQDKANVIAGLQQLISQNDFLNYLHQHQLHKVVKYIQTQPNMLIDIPAGLIHAITAGNQLLEFQENSDTTFRLYDWNRSDQHGNKRELHIKESLQCIDFNQQTNIQTHLVNMHMNYNLLHNRLFNAYHYKLHQQATYYSRLTSFEIIAVVQGSLLISANNEEVLLNNHDICLLPANTQFKLLNIDDNPTNFITVNINT